jgi:hypothetical protein
MAVAGCRKHRCDKGICACILSVFPDIQHAPGILLSMERSGVMPSILGVAAVI